MAVDKNLFLYDLAVVAIMKNETPYIKEWLDYHLLAGVNHFYIYDNQDDDEQKKIMQPYIDAGLVTHIPYPGKVRQCEAYNDSVKKYKFFCRYMAFIDGDEFIFPKDTRSITEVVDEILKDNSQIGGLAINWQIFGSNFQEKADYSRGVLERFTRRAPDIAGSVKSVTNPRKINYLHTTHYAAYFDGIFHAEKHILKNFFGENFNLSDKIVVNHYNVKSREEFSVKITRGDAVFATNNHHYNWDWFTDTNNDVLDDSILKYRDARKEILIVGGGGVIF